MRIRYFIFSCIWGVLLLASLRPACADTYVRFNTNLGNIDVQLFSAQGETPNTVTNFMSYVTSGAYTNVIINRSVFQFLSFKAGLIRLRATLRRGRAR